MEKRIGWSLLCLRVGVFIVMFMWTLDKFVRPGHAAAVFENFYFLSGIGASLMYILAALEMVLLAAFISGFKKQWSYGTVLVLHGISTLSSFGQYFAPFEKGNLLFFAAWPMLAACITLFILRDLDTIGVVRGR